MSIYCWLAKRKCIQECTHYQKRNWKYLLNEKNQNLVCCQYSSKVIQDLFSLSDVPWWSLQCTSFQFYPLFICTCQSAQFVRIKRDFLFYLFFFCFVSTRQCHESFVGIWVANVQAWKAFFVCLLWISPLLHFNILSLSSFYSPFR